VKWIGDPAGDFTSQVTLPNSLESEFALFAQDERGVAPSPKARKTEKRTKENKKDKKRRKKGM